MTQLGQVFHRTADSAWIVEDHAGHVGDGAVQRDHRALLGRHPDRRVRHPRGGQHDALDHRHRPVQRLPLQHVGFLGVGQQDGVPGLAGRGFGAADDLVVERVGDVGDHQGDHRGAAGRQGPGHRVGAITQLRGDLSDVFRGLGVHPAGPGEGPGHRRRRHPGRRRDVVDRRQPGTRRRGRLGSRRLGDHSRLPRCVGDTAVRTHPTLEPIATSGNRLPAAWSRSTVMTWDRTRRRHRSVPARAAVHTDQRESQR